MRVGIEGLRLRLDSLNEIVVVSDIRIRGSRVNNLDLQFSIHTGNIIGNIDFKGSKFNILSLSINKAYLEIGNLNLREVKLNKFKVSNRGNIVIRRLDISGIQSNGVDIVKELRDAGIEVGKVIKKSNG